MKLEGLLLLLLTFFDFEGRDNRYMHRDIILGSA
jgi:hypothetical protein